MGRIFNQKEWLDELDEMDRERKDGKQDTKSVKQNYWITDAAQKLPQRENRAYMQMWDKLHGRTSLCSRHGLL